ncbi:hypothetical protein [Rheinheimera soli]|uniref:hypothetical protein n=1 Tax=Rheinheimera soli TaxID=443616 RepID=UPI001E471307|nr:hypothetical protein [Rheinheimera soli]
MTEFISTVDEDGGVSCLLIQSILSTHAERILALLTVNFSDIIPRAECYNLNIEHVQDEGDGQFTVSYNFDYNVYNGCSDMDVESDWDDSFVVTVENGKIFLEVPEIASYQNRQFD